MPMEIELDIPRTAEEREARRAATARGLSCGMCGRSAPTIAELLHKCDDRAAINCPAFSIIEEPTAELLAALRVALYHAEQRLVFLVGDTEALAEIQQCRAALAKAEEPS